MAEQVAVSFTGITGVRGAEFSLTRGISPSMGIIYALPQDNVDISSGTLTISSGDTSITIGGCAVALGPIRKSVSKWPIQAFHILDRRWKWRFSTISGDYNRRLSDGTLDTSTQKTPSELAGLLLSALGESGYDTSRMPTTVKPRAKWFNQRADLALQDLCDKCACEVLLNHQSGGMEIWPSGLGITLPTNSGEILPKYRYVPRHNVPAVIKVVGGPSMFQSRLKLAAVNRKYETNVQYKVTDNQLIADYTVESPFSFPSLTDSNKRAIAFDEYWRAFRVIGQQDGTKQPPNCPAPVSSIDQYRLTETLLETESDLEGKKRSLPCYLDGDFWAWTDLPNNGSSIRFNGRFVVDKDRYVVTTAYPVFKLDSSGKYADPTLYLTTGYSVVDNTNTLVAVSQQGNVGGSGGTLVLRRPEVFAIYSTSTNPVAQTNTESQANTELAAYVSIFQQKYANPNACEVTYKGISAIALDGNIAQVTWRALHSQPPTTTACEQDELDISAVPLKRRRLDAIIDRLAEAYL